MGRQALWLKPVWVDPEECTQDAESSVCGGGVYVHSGQQEQLHEVQEAHLLMGSLQLLYLLLQAADLRLC